MKMKRSDSNRENKENMTGLVLIYIAGLTVALLQMRSILL